MLRLSGLSGPLLLALFGALGACSAGEGELASPRAYVVHATLMKKPGQSPSAFLETPAHEFNLQFDPKTPAFIINGVTVGARRMDSAFVATEPFFIKALYYGRCFGRSLITVKSFTVTVTPSDLEGRGEASLEQSADDVIYQYDATMTVVGRPDLVPPQLQDPGVVEPLSPMALVPSEALPAGATAKLVAGSESLSLEPITSEGNHLVTSFQTPAAIALRFATTYAIVITPWTDLAGNAGASLPTVTTPALPPLLAEDGFESAGPLFGGALIVQAPGTPVISGQRSAVVASHDEPPYSAEGGRSRLSPRLAVTPSDRVVRFALRPADSGTYGIGTDFYARLAAPGGAIVSAPLPKNPVQPGEGWTVEIALPVNVGSEVIFQVGLEDPGPDCLPFHHPRYAYLIDDVRVE
jgi:hypothetical protein